MVTIAAPAGARRRRGCRSSFFEIAYDNLKALARSRLRNTGRGRDLDTTALVHEAYLKFISTRDASCG